MKDFTFEKLNIEGLFIVNPFYAEDGRGYFLKSYEKEIFRKAGIETDIFEDFESWSRKNVIRGLHFQTMKPQSKLVRAVYGEIFDVAVDIRRESPTFGQWRGVHLSGENHKALFIPGGFAHGFLVLSDTALVSYKCSGQYLKECDTGIPWNDPDIGVEWPLESLENVIVSERDQGFTPLKCKIMEMGGVNPRIYHSNVALIILVHLLRRCARK